jgi:hypothetical protein
MRKVTVDDSYSVFSSYGAFTAIKCAHCKYYQYLLEGQLKWDQIEKDNIIFANEYTQKYLICYSNKSDDQYYKLHFNINLKHITLEKVKTYITFS